MTTWVTFLRRRAGCNHPLAHQAVEHVHPRDARARLEVADAGVDHHDLAAHVHDPELDGDDQLVHVRNPVVRRHQLAVFFQHLAVHLWEEERRVVGGACVFEYAGDLDVTDLARLHHGAWFLIVVVLLSRCASGGMATGADAVLRVLDERPVERRAGQPGAHITAHQRGDQSGALQRHEMPGGYLQRLDLCSASGQAVYF
ncbi:hypothetical protein N5938_25395 [Pseudomonas aeruginosa]|uniref:hypothetical protein n=1 Tax=Pseudomonas aeruginosa TaxID=287 RepID=UPI0021F16E8B|nr:hypothetical protein [Pseudomonas aeruginosa]UYM59832.1 hypothetical protein N5938_25395 [Pseudomonas aeruginosa]